MSEGSDVPDGWTVSEVAYREWEGVHAGPAGIDLRIYGVSREVVIERINSLVAYRAANGFAGAVDE